MLSDLIRFFVKFISGIAVVLGFMLLMQVPASSEDRVEYTRTFIKTLQHELNATGRLRNNPDGVFDEKTRNALNVWLQNEKIDHEFGYNFSSVFNIRKITPVLNDGTQVGQAKPFAILEGVQLGGNELRNTFKNPELRSTSFEQCLALCAADSRCEAVSFNHGCSMLSDYSYRLGADSDAAVLIARSKSETNSDIVGPGIEEYKNFFQAEQMEIPSDVEITLADLAGSDLRLVDISELEWRFKQITNRSLGELDNPSSLTAAHAGVAPSFATIPWIFISEKHKLAAEAWESASGQEEETQMLRDLFAEALEDAESRFGVNNPILALVIHDMAFALSWYKITNDQAYAETQSLRLKRLQKGAQLAANVRFIGHFGAPDVQLSLQINSIDYDQAMFADFSESESKSEFEAKQWGRCYGSAAANLKRSQTIIDATRQHQAGSVWYARHLGWLRRAQNCLVSSERVNNIINHRLMLSKVIDDQYGEAFAWTDLGRNLFNEKRLEEARRAFGSAFNVFQKKPNQYDFMEFIHTHRGSMPYSASEFYSEEDERIADVPTILIALNMQDALKTALVNELEFLVQNPSQNIFEVDYNHRAWMQAVLNLNDGEFANTTFSYLDNHRSGRNPGSAIRAFMDVLKGSRTGYESDIIALSSILLDHNSPATDKLALLTFLAFNSDGRGDFIQARDFARQAIKLSGSNQLNIDPAELKLLKEFVARVEREQGDVLHLASELASSLETKLEQVCSGKVDLAAFPDLSVHLLHDDEHLTDGFFKSSAIEDYLNCFYSNQEHIDIDQHQSGVLPIERLLDVGFLLAKLNLEDEARKLIMEVSRPWPEKKRYQAREFAISRLIDGIILGDRAAWLEGLTDNFRAELDETQSHASNGLVHLAFTLDSIGMHAEVSRIQGYIRSSAIKNGLNLVNTDSELRCYSGSSSVGFGCSLELYLAMKLSSYKPSSKLLDDFNNSIWYFDDNNPSYLQQTASGEIYRALHQKANRHYIAERIAGQLYAPYSTSPESFVREFNRDHRVGTLRYITSVAKNRLINGERGTTLSLVSPIVEQIKAETQALTVFGDDPIVRKASRFRNVFETFIDSSQLTQRRGRDDLTYADDLQIFAGQFLQFSNTASTFSKMSLRNIDTSSTLIEELQRNSRQISKIYDQLSIGKISSGSRAELILDLNAREAFEKKSIASLDASEMDLLRKNLLRFPSAAELMESLRSGEALLSMYVGQDNTVAWLFTEDAVYTKKYKISRDEVKNLVSRIRNQTNPANLDEDINTKPLREGYELLLSPFENALQNVNSLILVPHGPLDSLPFSALLTAPVPQDYISIQDLRSGKLPWLIRQYQLSQLPSLSSAVTLRNQSDNKDLKNKPFFGVGNPNFAPAIADDSNVRRGLKNDFGLRALPDTEIELVTLAALFGADTNSDLLLREAANELELSKRNLSNYGILAFATHGVIADELSGIDEPALILSKSDQSPVNHDGILLASEIAEMKLNADLVILSACNTAASDGNPGAEGLSGLANAFFFAGARSLIVTHWQIPSNSALDISLGTAIYAQGASSLGWSSSLRRAVLDIIDIKGSEVFAHPQYWAAHIFIGMPT